MSKWFWVPVQLITTGYARVEADTPEEAMEMVESGEFNQDEIVNEEIGGVAVTGAAMVQEVS